MVDNKDDIQKSELSNRYWRSIVSHCLVPVAKDEEEKAARAETSFKVVSEDILQMTREYEITSNE